MGLDNTSPIDWKMILYLGVNTVLLAVYGVFILKEIRSRK